MKLEGPGTLMEGFLHSNQGLSRNMPFVYLFHDLRLLRNNTAENFRTHFGLQITPFKLTVLESWEFMLHSCSPAPPAFFPLDSFISIFCDLYPTKHVKRLLGDSIEETRQIAVWRDEYKYLHQNHRGLDINLSARRTRHYECVFLRIVFLVFQLSSQIRPVQTSRQ